MIRQDIDVNGYWKVIVIWNVDYDLFDLVEKELMALNISEHHLKAIRYMMYSGRAKAVTYSHYEKHTSIVLFNKHKSVEDYLNSIVHEAEHVKQAMLKEYQVEDKGEPPAYTIGYLVMRMYEVFKGML